MKDYLIIAVSTILAFGCSEENATQQTGGISVIPVEDCLANPMKPNCQQILEQEDALVTKLCQEATGEKPSGCPHNQSSDEINQAITDGFSKPQTITPGDTVVLKGLYHSQQVSLTIDGESVEIAPSESNEISFIAPDAGSKALAVTLTVKEAEYALPSMFSLAGDGIPLITAAADTICSSQEFYNADGELTKGTKDCSVVAVPDCAEDGATGCVTTAGFPAADSTGLAAKVVSGSTVAGISGTLSLPSTCSSDGATGCVTTESFAAAATTGLAAKVVSGNTVAGVSGTTAAKPSDCSADGATGCVTTESFAAAATAGLAAKVVSGNTVAGVEGNVTIPLEANVGNGVNYGASGTEFTGSASIEAHVDCAADGSQGCVASGTYYAATACSSNGDNDCFAAASGSYDAADLTNLSAGNILSGITIAGQAGNITLPAAGKVLTGTNFGPANGTDGTLTLPNAADVKSGTSNYGDPGAALTPSLTTRGTWNLTASFPGAGYYTGISNPPAAGDLKRGVQVNGVTGNFPSSTSPLPRYSSANGASLAELGTDEADLSLPTFDSKIKSSVTFEYWDSVGQRHEDTGDADILASNIVSGKNLFGTEGTAATSTPDCSSIPGSWILIPGDPDYGTNDFCVMKYEAKCSLSNGQDCTASMATESPTSTPESTPWVSIGQQNAMTECASLGKGYHLITNDQWMTIATNVANVGSNWSNGSVGNAQLKRGHSDRDPVDVCAASTDESLNVVESDCTAKASGNDDFIEQRTFTLSNGEIIWDLSGNVSEHTSDFNSSQKATPNGFAWREFSSLTGTAAMPISDIVPQIALDNSWNSTDNSVGQVFLGNDGQGGAIRRGGCWGGGIACQGVFSLSADSLPDFGNGEIGFRCVVSVP